MAKTDKKKHKRRRKSESEELSSNSLEKSIERKPSKRRKKESVSSSFDFDVENNKTLSNDRKRSKRRKKENVSSSSDSDIEDNRTPNDSKKRKKESVSSSSDSDIEDNRTPSNDRKPSKRRKKESVSNSSNSDIEDNRTPSNDRKPSKKRKKESVSSSSDSDFEDNRTSSKENTSRRTAPSSDSDSETPQQSQNTPTHKTPPTKSPNLLQTFKNANELNEVSTKPRHLLSDLSDSDVFFVQIPKNLHPQLLTDTLVSLDEKTKLRLGKASYIWDTSDPDLIPLNVMELRKKGKGVIKRLDCPRIIVREQFKSKQFPLELGQHPDEAPVPFPVDLKSRHPLFGSEYADKIKLDEGVRHKLNSAREKRVKERKEKRRKRDSKNESEVYEEMFASQNDLGGVMSEKNELNFEVKRKKKRKRGLDE